MQSYRFYCPCCMHVIRIVLYNLWFFVNRLILGSRKSGRSGSSFVRSNTSRNSKYFWSFFTLTRHVQSELVGKRRKKRTTKSDIHVCNRTVEITHFFGKSNPLKKSTVSICFFLIYPLQNKSNCMLICIKN